MPPSSPRPHLTPSPQPSVQPHGTRYLLPCTVLGLGGLYEWCLVDVALARRWVTSGPYLNHISHPFLQEACETLLEVQLRPPERGMMPALGYHDDALVFSVAGYEAPWALWRGDRAQVQAAFALDLVTLGVLRRLA